ncbi:Chromatin assembly factor 1 subunit p60 [Spathaspora sp. JA1]|nr:Chromatin assembly factor 1 subunit p60 [Spathaspora sp. JA1]
MEASTITVHWHNDNSPIYSIDFQPGSPTPRLVTGGGDNNIRVWNLTDNNNNNQAVEYLSTLRKHTQAVNVVRFNPNGTLLASAGDDGTLMLWQLCDGIVKEFGEDEQDDDDIKESWKVVAQFRSGTSEIMDICWSPCGQYLVSGSMDNIVRIYQLTSDNAKVSGKLIHSLKSHNHYIQGVYWDPLDEYIVSQSADRSINIYKITHTPSGSIKDIKLHRRFFKHNGVHLYHPESLQSFFRRLSFSPDGSLLITPAGIEESEIENSNNNSGNSAYVYTRGSLSHAPVFKITGLSKPAIAVSFHPYKFQGVSKSLKLDYKMIFAIATQDSIVIYSTEEFKPLGYVSNLHYSTITDLRWDVQGSRLIICSTDGFCSVIKFDQGIFGNRYTEPVQPEVLIIPEVEMIEIAPSPTPPAIENLNLSSSPIRAEAKIDTFFPKKEKKRIAPTLVS